MCEYSVKNRYLTSAAPCKPRYIVLSSNRFVIIKFFVNMYKTESALLCNLDALLKVRTEIIVSQKMVSGADDRLER